MALIPSRFFFVLLGWSVLLLQACGGDTVPDAQGAAPELVVYSARKEHLIKPLFDRYRELTGIRVRTITADAAPLLARLKTEGDRSPADLLMTVDAGNLWYAAHEGVLATLESAILNENVPAYLRDEEGRWVGLTIRARTIVFATERVVADELSTYEALAEDQWKGRLCLRTSKKVYNQSLVATMIAALGPERTQQVVRGWVSNLAVGPFANDTMAMEALLAGRCDVTIVNSYYFGRLQSQYSRAGKTFPLAIFWPNQRGRGVHINISGAGVTRYTTHPEESRALLEWLTGVEAQTLLTQLNQEYPVNNAAVLTPQMRQWGEFVADERPVSNAGRLQTEAVMLMDRADYR